MLGGCKVTLLVSLGTGARDANFRLLHISTRVFEKTICMEPAFTRFVPEMGCVLAKHDLRAFASRRHTRMQLRQRYKEGCLTTMLTIKHFALTVKNCKVQPHNSQLAKARVRCTSANPTHGKNYVQPFRRPLSLKLA